LQSEIRGRRQAGAIPDVLLLLEHPPTFTRGRRAGDGELPLGEDVYRQRGIEVVATDRGGRVTYHGPGQLVGYLIVAVTDVVAHVRTMEHAIVAALAEHSVQAHSRAADGPDYTGVWVAARKIASIGVHVAGGVSTHGFAINVDNDLTPFSWVIPCGLQDVRMTSVVEAGGQVARSAAGERWHKQADPAQSKGSLAAGQTPLMTSICDAVSRHLGAMRGTTVHEAELASLGVALGAANMRLGAVAA
jgi:lipoyl(octanoyl) transferase